MKRIVLIVLAALLILSTLAACGEDSNKDGSNNRYDSSQKNDYSDSDYNEDNEIDGTIPLKLNKDIVGCLEEFDSINTYSFYVPASGVLDMYFSSEDLSDSGKFYLTMLDVDDNTLFSDDIYGGDQDVHMFRDRLGEGTYYLRISGDHTYVAKEEYTVYISYTDESGDSFVEHEWNNTEDTANYVDVGVEYAASLNTNNDKYEDGDVDYFCFELEEEKVLKLFLKMPTGVYLPEYKLRGVFGNYSLAPGLDDIYQEFNECYTKTVRLEPGVHTFYFESDDTMQVGDCLDYYFTIEENN